MNRRDVLLGLGTLSALAIAGVPALAQDYPQRPIRLIVPRSAGGVLDVIGRQWADSISTRPGVVTVIENRGGGGGITGTAAVDLVGGRQRQLVDEPDETRVLVRRRMGEREALDVVFARPAAGLRDDEGDRLVALDVVLDRNDSRLADVGMSLEHALDVARIDVLAAGIEHVVAAPDEIVETVAVAAEDVTGDIEAVRRDRRLDVGAVVIAQHDGGALHLQHALVGVAVVAVHQAQLHLGMPTADRHVGNRQPLRVRSEHHRSRLGRAVRIGDGGMRQRPLQRRHQALAHRRRTHAHEFDAGEVGRRHEIGLPQHHGDHRRHRGQPGGAIAADRFDIGARRKLRQQHDGAVAGNGELGQRQRIHVIERRRDQIAVARQVLSGEPRLDHPDVAAVG